MITSRASSFFRSLRANPAALLLALALGFGATGPALAECLGAGAARAAVASGEALPLGSIAGRLGGEIVRADLCRQGGRLVYVLSVLVSGRVSERVVDARTGQILR
ncbi:hypothetical protein [Stappia sp.]|uniref:PepSY domain-containing protein n=1 Tax=Stappia sp. TaxID=1870903 RepID=UPI0032D9538E